jgi:hypothetical protein
MSAINTGSIDVSFPTPGVNNNSQGFRDNFGAIKTALDTASDEITDLQQKAVVKQALVDIPLNNDMANTLISNALVQNFRATTYNLGNSLSGTVSIDVTAGDVQFGTISGNVNLNFSKWAPAGTQSNVQVILNVANTSANWNISFPDNVTDGLTTLENYSGNGVGGVATVPTGVNRLHYNFTTIDCGTNIEVQPLDRPRIPQGPGSGTVTSVAVVGSGAGINVTGGPVTTAGTINITNTGVTSLVAGSGISLSGSNGAVTISSTGISTQISYGSAPSSTGSSGDVQGAIRTDGTYVYICTANYTTGTVPIWRRIALSSY